MINYNIKYLNRRVAMQLSDLVYSIIVCSLFYPSLIIRYYVEFKYSSPIISYSTKAMQRTLPSPLATLPYL